MKSRRSDQGNIFYAVFSADFQAVVLRMKTVMNHRCFFLIMSELNGPISKIPTVLRSGAFTLQTYGSFFENFHQKWKLPNQTSKKNLSVR